MTMANGLRSWREWTRARELRNSTRLLPILLTSCAAFCTRVRDRSSRGHSRAPTPAGYAGHTAKCTGHESHFTVLVRLLKCSRYIQLYFKFLAGIGWKNKQASFQNRKAASDYAKKKKMLPHPPDIALCSELC